MAHQPRNTFSAAGGLRPSAATTLPVPQPPMLPAFPQDRPTPGQPHGHDGALQNIVFPPANAASNRWPDGSLEGVPPLTEDITVRGERQDPEYNDMDYHGVVHHLFMPPADPTVPSEYHDHGINSYARVAQDVPAQAQAVTPPDPVTDMGDHPAQNPSAGMAPFPDELPYQGPVPNEQATEVLRLLANHFLNQSDSEVDAVHLEPSPVGRVRVVITLNIG